jgi:hypothetical protein
MSEKSSNSSGSDEDVDPESGHPVELGGVLSKVSPTKRLIFIQMANEGVILSKTLLGYN